MTATIGAIMIGVENRLATITGLRVSDVAPEQISPPCAIVGVPPIPQYRLTMNRGSYKIGLTVTVLVSAAVSRVGQQTLAGYANPTGAGSIPAAIEADRTLGGTVSDCIIQAFRPLSLQDVGVIGYYGGVFDLDCIAGP